MPVSGIQHFGELPPTLCTQGVAGLQRFAYYVKLEETARERRINIILEMKGFDPLADVKRGAAERWVEAVRAAMVIGV